MYKFRLFHFLVFYFIFILISCSNNEGKIKSVAPLAFYNYGKTIEIIGGWNFSSTRYESTKIYCDSLIKICSDCTVRMVNGHLHIANMLWKVIYWDEIIVAESATSHLYRNHYLYINLKTENTYIVTKPNEHYVFNKNDMNNLKVVEKIQNTFYQRKQK